MSVTADWYPDPDNPSIERWWDGSKWTDDRRMPERRAVGVVSLCLSVLGIVAVVVSLTVVDWLHFDGIGETPHFTARFLADDQTLPGFANAFFAWLGWLMLALVSAAAIAGALPIQAQGALRATAGVSGVIAMIVVVFATANVDEHNDLIRILPDFSAGPYIAVGGFLLLAIAGAAGRVGT